MVAENARVGPWGYQLEGDKGYKGNVFLFGPNNSYTNT